MQELLWFYLVIFALPTAILFTLALPVWRFPAPVGGKLPPTPSTASSASLAVSDIGLTVGGEKLTPSRSATLDGTPPAGEEVFPDYNISAGKPAAVSSEHGDMVSTTWNTSLGGEGGAAQQEMVAVGAEAAQENKDGDGEAMEAHRVDWQLLGLELQTPEFWLYGAFLMVGCLQIGYYPTTLRAWGEDWQGLKISEVYGIITPTQFVYGVAFGALVEVIGTVAFAFIMIAFLIIEFGLSLVPVYGLQYVPVMMNNFVNCFIFTSRFTYTAEKFMNRNFGILVGILGALPALGYPIMFGVQAPNVFDTLYIILLSINVISLGCIIALFVRQKRGVNQKNRTVARLAERRAGAVGKASAAGDGVRATELAVAVRDACDSPAATPATAAESWQ